MNNIKTIAAGSESKFKEKGSVFIGRAYPVNEKEEAEKFLDEIRKKYFDASHHCYAYRIFNGETRYSDAGEPSGSAGIRIMNAIEHFGLTNVLTAVIRYFGGTKLGIGPLGKAYYNSAVLTIQSSQIVEKIPAKRIFIEADPVYSKQVQKILRSMKAEITDSRYDEKMRLECLAQVSTADQIISGLKEAVNDAIIIKIHPGIIFI